MTAPGRREARFTAATSMTQMDPTTCGATCLLVASALLGREPVGGAVAGAGGGQGAPPGEGPADAQRRIQRSLNRRAIARLVPWPRAFGSTPWSLARELTRMTGRRYRVRWTRDTGRAFPEALEEARAHLADGLPILLLAGGPLLRAPADRAGWRNRARSAAAAMLAGPAIPRHYVLALPRDGARLPGDCGPGQLRLYEPGGGRVHEIDLLSALAQGARPGRLGAAARPRRQAGGPEALGHWPRVLALILPR